MVDSDHLGIGYLTAVLEQRGIRTRAFHPAHMTIDDVVRELQPLRERILGVSFYSSTLAEVRRLIRSARQVNPATHITLGGLTATFWARELLGGADPPDSIVMGEGELTLSELAGRVLDGRSYQDVKGLALPGRPPTFTPPRPLIEDLDTLPFPQRSSPRTTGTPVRIEHGRGCSANCSFCNIRSFTALQPGPRIRMRSISSVLDEIRLIQRNNPTVELFEIVDSNFVLPGVIGRERLAAWADEIERTGLRFGFAINCRAPEVDFAVFKRLKQAGLRKVYLGVETMAPSGLRRFNKNVTVEQNHRAIQILTDLGIMCRLGLIIIDPLVTIDELLTNLSFVADTPAHVELHKLLKGLRAERGNPISEQLLRDGFVTDYYPFGETRFRDPALPRFFRLARTSGVAQWLAFLAPISQAMERNASAYREIRSQLVSTLIHLATFSRSQTLMSTVDCSTIRDALRENLLELTHQVIQHTNETGGSCSDT